MIRNGFLALSTAMILVTQSTFAGEEMYEKNKISTNQDSPEAKSRWSGQLTEGWDSLYMYRGVNSLRGNQKYGSSLLWTDLSLTFNATASDAFTVDVWNAFGLYKTSYKETDVTLTYTHTFGNLFASLGYEFYALTDNQLYANELQAKIGYNIALGSVTLTPSVSYFFNLGPSAPSSRFGQEPTTASFLALRLDAVIPVYKDLVSLTPWIAYGQNFRYNARTQSDGSSAFFDGANNIELGVAIPVKVNRFITVSGYGAYSYNFDDLVGTSPSTFWGGAKITFAF